MKRQDLNKFSLPHSAGVYFFLDKEGHILYIGKATSLKDRVRSYFNPDVIKSRGLKILSMVTIAESIKFEETPSVLEALLLESRLIKKNSPIYNTRDKDDRSYSCIVITKEKYPRVLVMRVRDYEKKFTKKEIDAVYGPFVSFSQLQDVLRIIRPMFPFCDKCEPGKGKPCFNAQIRLCPGVCIGEDAISPADYKKNIRNIKRLFEGKKTDIKKSLQREMKEQVAKENFEKAAIVRNTLFALDHIKDTSLIKNTEIMSFKNNSFKIEAYDIAHISGTNRVGVMVVIEGGEKSKDNYRKFKLVESMNDDYEGYRELLSRRLNHPEWRLPDLIVIDGGIGQKRAAEAVLADTGMLIPCVAVVKNARHKPKDILGDKVHVDYHKKEILLANSEAHRFAISYHKTLRNRGFKK